MLLITFLILTLLTTSLTLVWIAPSRPDSKLRSILLAQSTVSVQRHGRFGRLHTRTSPCGRSPRLMGLRPRSSTASSHDSIQSGLRWIGFMYEKRNRYQFHGERTPYRHS